MQAHEIGKGFGGKWRLAMCSIEEEKEDGENRI